jgi:hypothetical protein
MSQGDFMKLCAWVVLLLFSGRVWATCADVQKPVCLPGTAESTDWPVAAIYMHGLFEDSGVTAFCDLESSNRKKLKEIALKLKVRIAVPVADMRGTYHNWGTKRTATKEQLPEIEKKAEAACDDELMDGRALVAFSNGCYRATAMRESGCEALGEYAKIVTLGCETAKDGSSTCDGTGATSYFHESTHEFPKAIVSKELEFLAPKSGVGIGDEAFQQLEKSVR